MLGRTAATACCVALLACAGFAQAASADGSFESSDSLVNLIWRNSVQTARDMVSPPVNLDRRGCEIDLATILLDGAERDRCPYIGDQAVTGMTLLVSQDDVRVLRDMLAWFAAVQNEDGSIPASPFSDHSLVLVDYNAYWIESLYDYVLYTGDIALLRQVWPNWSKLVDELYPAHVGGRLLVNWLGAGRLRLHPARRHAGRLLQRAVRPRAPAGRVARGLVRRRRSGPTLGGARGRHGRGVRRRLLGRRRRRVPRHDRRTDVHALDGNAFAILAGLATPAQAQSVLAYVDRTMRRSYGNSVADTNGWRGCQLGRRRLPARLPVHLVLRGARALRGGRGRLRARADQTGVGVHGHRGPGTMWETIANESGGQVDGRRRGITAGRAAPRRRSRATCSACSRPRPASRRSASRRTRAG